MIQNQSKYKTMLCKHFETNKGCSFGDKCQFAHGASELRASNYPNQQQNTSYMQTPKQQLNQPKKGPNPQNFKIVKCKYWEKDGTCRYGSLCTFAHGDLEIRSKNENMMRVQQQMFPFMDLSNPMMSPMGMGAYPMKMMNPFMFPSMDPNQMGFFNPENQQNFDMNPNMNNPYIPMGNFHSGGSPSNLPTDPNTNTGINN